MRLREVLIVATAFVLAGCVDALRPAGARYVSESEPVAGSPQTLTVYDLDSAAQALIGKMLNHPQFVKNYNAVKDEKGKLPILCMGLLDNKTSTSDLKNTGVDLRPRLRAVTDTIRVALFDTGLFEIKDDESSDAVKSRIIIGADGGIENAKDLVALLGEHEVPEFIVLGDVRHFEDVGGYHTYKLHLAIHNLRTFKIVWEGIQTKVKL